VLDRFADYWDKDRIHIDRVTYFSIPTARCASPICAPVRSICWSGCFRPTFRRARDAKLKPWVPSPAIAYTGLTINLANTDQAKNPLGQNAKVRQALELSLDRDAINKVVFNGEFVPGNQFSSPTNAYYVQKFPGPGAQHREGQGADQGGGCRDADHR